MGPQLPGRPDTLPGSAAGSHVHPYQQQLLFHCVAFLSVRFPQLDHNALADLPPSLAALPALTSLSASHNRLTALPLELGEADHLEPGKLAVAGRRLAELNFSGNQLTAVPHTIGE